MWKKTCHTARGCIAEPKEYNKQRYDKNHNENYFREGDQVLVSTLNFNNLKGAKKMKNSFLGTLNITRLTGKNSVEVQLTEEFFRKHTVFQVRLVKPDNQAGEDKFSFRNEVYTPQKIVEVEESPGPVKKFIKVRKIRLNGKDHIQYLVIFKNQTADKDKVLAEYAIPDSDLTLGRFRASRRA
ncbi:hypothetical protein O181_014119 [Austropuccinia psidii MF-1]|uniref:Uncharacterized protein n=1 Tax=Austropuccinia psidii MF-1 TaxID=1389203 RepID=A0A9Q3BXK7_9BASI|nr:hypothetical protein [Austropuccinia psidii MF-1]